MTVATRLDHGIATVHEITERTPLLSDNGKHGTIKRTPLPMASVAVLCFSRIMEPMALTVVFPFVNQMLESFFQWGRLSDRIGRKPVILFGLAGCSVSCIAFGLSQNVVAMALARVLAGILNGNVGVIKSSMGELSDHTNEASAFRFLPPTWTFGAALGPIIGGALADPARQYPNYFGSNAFFLKYRYAIPCFVGALFPMFGIGIGLFYLKETLPAAKRIIKQNDDESRALQAGKIVPDNRSLLTRRVCLTLTNYAMLALTSVVHAGIFPVFMYTPVNLGGLGLPMYSMGIIMGCQAFLSTFLELIAFPPLQGWLGTIYIFRCTVIFYTIAYTLYPITSWIARDTLARGSDSLVPIYAALGMQILCLSVANLAYSCNMLLINAAAPSAQLLGALNGLAQTISSFVRTFGLVVGTSIYAVSVHRNLLGGQAVWIFMIATSLCLSGSSWLVTDAKASWRHEIIVAVDRDEDEER